MIVTRMESLVALVAFGVITAALVLVSDHPVQVLGIVLFAFVSGAAACYLLDDRKE